MERNKLRPDRGVGGAPRFPRAPVTASLHLAVSRSNRGGVAEREVGDTGCWDLPSDSGVGPMVVVPVQEVRTGGLALRRVSRRIGQGQVIVRQLHAGQRWAVEMGGAWCTCVRCGGVGG